MRYIGYMFLALGIAGVIADNTLWSCIGAIVGSVLIQGDVLLKHKDNLKC